MTAAALPDTVIEGAADWGNPRLAATDSCLYAYAPEPGIGDQENPLGMLIRVTFDEADSTVHIENLTDTLTSLIDPARNNHIALAAGDNYCVIVANAKDGVDTHILYDDSTTAVPYDQYRSTLLNKARELHMAYGIGAQLIIDYNFIPTVTFGIPFDKRDGKYGLYMTLDYIF